MTRTELATWVLTRWLAVHQAESWPGDDDPELVRVRRLTGRSPTDFSDANVAAVSTALYALPAATLQAEYDRWRRTGRRAAETFVDRGTTEVVTPNLPDPNPIDSLLRSLATSVPWWVWAAGAATAAALLLRR